MKIKYFILIISVLGFFGCASTTRYINNSESSNTTTSEISDYDDASILQTEYTVASYYADKFNGRKTANGETYDMYGISAAHISYPFGTIVKVTNMSNGKSIILKINDRKPDTNGRDIDLSLGAAKKLEMVQSGIAKVRIDVLKWGKN
jgi:rare lipoprotein A